MLDPEDQGPSWLRDYGFTDFGSIEADITAMEQFATKLQGDVSNNYETHRPTVQALMLTQLPPPPIEFSELYNFLVVHNDAQDVSQQNMFQFGPGTQQFAEAAKDIGGHYKHSDAFSHAKVSDVSSAFNTAAAQTEDNTLLTTSDGSE
jgi:hypothetical protein